MKNTSFPGIEVTVGDADRIEESHTAETCGICRYAQRTGGFHPGLTCLNRNSKNYLKRISETQEACESITNNAKL